MGKAFCYLPLALAGVSASSSAPGTEAGAVANDHMGVVWTSAGGAPSASLTIDLGSVQAFDTVLMVGCTAASADWNLTVESATNAAFTSGVAVHADAIPFLAGAVLPSHGRGVSLWTNAAMVARRYVRLTVGNLGGSPVTIGRLAIGKRIQLERNFTIGAAWGVRDLGRVEWSSDGVLLRRRAAKLRVVGLSFPAVTRDEAEALVQPLIEIAAGQEPIVLVTDPDLDDMRQRRCFFGMLTGELGTTQRTARAWEWRANLTDLVKIAAGTATLPAVPATPVPPTSPALPARPAPPPAPAEVISVTDLATPGIPTDGSDAAPAINALLATGDRTVILPEDCAIASAIIQTSGSRLLGRTGPRSRVRALPSFTGGTDNMFNAVITNQPGATDFITFNVDADARGLFIGGVVGDPTRISGIKTLGAQRVRRQLTLSSNCSGYGNFDQYAVVHGDVRDVIWDRCGSTNCSYAFEQLGALNSYIIDGWFDDLPTYGASQMNLAGGIHPVTGTAGLSVIRMVGRGAFVRGISVIANEGRVIDGLYFEDLDINVSGGAEAFFVEGAADTRNVIFVVCKLKGKQGATLSRTSARAFGTTFEADSSAGNAIALTLVANSSLEADASTRVVGRSTFEGGSAYGISIDGTSTLAFDGQVSGTPGAGGGYFPLSGPGVKNVTLGKGAQLVPNGIIENSAGLLDADPSMLGAIVRFTAAYDQTLRIPADTSDTTLPVGKPIFLERLGAGVPSVVAGSGVTLTAADGTALDTPLATGRIVRSGANAWTFAKDLVAAPAPDPDPEPEPEPPAPLGNSVPLTGYGAGLTLGAVDSDGFVPFNTTGSTSDYHAVGTTSTLAGDFVAELELVSLGAMAMGMDAEAFFAFRGLGELTHSIQVAPSGGTNALQLWAGSTPLTILTRDGRVYIQQVGTTLSYYTGASRAAALAAGAIWTGTAPTDTATTRFVGLAEIARDVVARIKVVAL